MDKRVILFVLALALPLASSAEDRKPPQDQAPQTAEDFYYLITSTDAGKKYYKRDREVIDVDLKTAIENFKPRMHNCYDEIVTVKSVGVFSRVLDSNRYTSTLRWKGKNKVLFTVQMKNLSGNAHYPKRIIQPKDGFFVGAADFQSKGPKQTEITLYWRGGFMSGETKKVLKPVYAWSQAKKDRCVFTGKKI